MFKHLGTFALLAACLFALAMGDCNGNNGGGTTKPKIDPPPTTTTETPMEKLDGSYTLVEVRIGNDIVRPPEITGDLFLFSAAGYNFTLFLGTQGQPITALSGPWSADETHLTLGADRTPYNWDGTHLRFDVPNPDGGTFNLKYRQDVAF